MKTLAKNPSKFSGIEPTARLKPEKVKNTASKVQAHSSFNDQRSEHYHAKIVGEPRPNNQGGLGPDEVNRTGSVKTRRRQMSMQSPRPGLTAQRGLGG